MQISEFLFSFFKSLILMQQLASMQDCFKSVPNVLNILINPVKIKYSEIKKN